MFMKRFAARRWLEKRKWNPAKKYRAKRCQYTAPLPPKTPIRAVCDWEGDVTTRPTSKKYSELPRGDRS